MIKEYIINLSEISSAMDLMNKFSVILDWGNWDIHGNPVWDAFRDNISSFDFESKAPENFFYKEIKGIHLVLENYKSLESIDPNDKKIFEEILEEMTHKENRYDGYEFSYEIKH